MSRETFHDHPGRKYGYLNCIVTTVNMKKPLPKIERLDIEEKWVDYCASFRNPTEGGSLYVLRDILNS